MRTATGRLALFFAFWLMIAGYHPTDIPVGLIAAALATWASLRLLPPTGVRLRPLALARYALRFLGQSASAGLDVARLAFDPKLPLRPGFITWRCHLGTTGQRNAFCAVSSLMPGTVPTGSDADGALIIHCLDTRQPVAVSMAEEEEAFARVLGHG